MEIKKGHPLSTLFRRLNLVALPFGLRLAFLADEYPENPSAVVGEHFEAIKAHVFFALRANRRRGQGHLRGFGFVRGFGVGGNRPKATGADEEAG